MGQHTLGVFSVGQCLAKTLLFYFAFGLGNGYTFDVSHLSAYLSVFAYRYYLVRPFFFRLYDADPNIGDQGAA
jgi:hypothetical protein